MGQDTSFSKPTARRRQLVCDYSFFFFFLQMQKLGILQRNNQTAGLKHTKGSIFSCTEKLNFEKNKSEPEEMHLIITDELNGLV